MWHNDGTFLYLIVDQSSFLFPISDVQEVSEMTTLRPYPIPFEGHLGVVNLRGQVIPVISLQQDGKNTHQESNRLIIARSAEFLFSFICSSVKKVVLNESQISELVSTKVTEIDGKPASILTAAEMIERGAA